MSVIVTALVLLVLNISWNFVLGVAGVWNFGQLAIYALGGYGAGIIMLHTPLSPWLAVLGGGVIAAFISVLLAFPTLRLYGIYTSLLTFAFAEIVQYSIVNDGSGLTGGSFGFPIVPGLYSHLSPDASMRAYYWTVLGVVVVSMSDWPPSTAPTWGSRSARSGTRPPTPLPAGSARCATGSSRSRYRASSPASPAACTSASTRASRRRPWG